MVVRIGEEGEEEMGARHLLKREGGGSVSAECALFRFCRFGLLSFFLRGEEKGGGGDCASLCFFFFLSLSFCGADADRAGVAGEGSKELEFGTVLTCGAR